MKRFFFRRVIGALLTLLAATIIVFGLSRAAGDPLLLYAQPGYGFTPERTEALRKKLGLDRPLVVQYFKWLGGVLRGDWGRSLRDNRLVREVIFGKVGASVQLALAAWIFATMVGVPLGIFSAIQRGTMWDYLGRTFALFGQALPVFWVGMMAVLIFSVNFGLLPTGDRPVHVSIVTNMKHFVLPAITLGWLPAATYLRITRSAMLEVLDEEYIKFARAKGVSQWKVVWKHALRNAIIPPLTISVLVMASFLGGSVVVESVFAWPGIGRLATQVVWNNDFPVLMMIVLLYGLTVVILNFLVDGTYALLDPRIRYD